VLVVVVVGQWGDCKQIGVLSHPLTLERPDFKGEIKGEISQRFEKAEQIGVLSHPLTLFAVFASWASGGPLTPYGILFIISLRI
jgi:hypothetical protein